MQFFKLIESPEFGGAYLLHGKEEFIKNRAVERVTALIDEAARDMNVQQFGEGASAADIMATCDMPPFFADRRLVVCRVLPKDADGEKLAKYIATMHPATILLFRVTGDADGRLTLTRKLRELKRDAGFNALRPEEAERWVKQQCARARVQLSPVNARKLISLAGTDMSNVNNELNKLIAYADGGEITGEAIDALVNAQSEYKMYKLLDTFVAGQNDKALRMLESFIRGGDSPMMIAATIANRLKAMLRAKELADAGTNKRDALRAIGGSPYAAEAAWNAARSFTATELTEAVQAFYDVGYAVVSGQMKDRDALNVAVYRHLLRKK